MDEQVLDVRPEPLYNISVQTEDVVKKTYQMRWTIETNGEWYYLPNPSARAGYDTRSIFKRSLTGLNSEFSFS